MMMQRAHGVRRAQRGFTLVELLITIGIIAILAAVVVVAINPQKQLAAARDSQRVMGAKQLSNALGQALLEKSVPNDSQIFSGIGSAKPVCKAGILADGSCVNIDGLVPTYVVALPVDAREPCTNYTGYKIYRQSSGFGVTPMRLGEMGGSICLWNGLVGYWKLSESVAGSTVNDYSGSGFNGSPAGSTFPQPTNQVPPALQGVDDKSLYFDGLASQFVGLGNTNFDYQNFTVAFWAKASTNTTTDPRYPIHVTNIVGKGDWNTLNEWYLGFKSANADPANGLTFAYGISWAAGPTIATNSIDISQWHHYAGVATPSQQILYIDGVAVNTVNIAHGSVNNALYELQIARSSYINRFFSGIVNDVRIYNRALSPQEVQKLASGSVD